MAVCDTLSRPIVVGVEASRQDVSLRMSSTHPRVAVSLCRLQRGTGRVRTDQGAIARRRVTKYVLVLSLLHVVAHSTCALGCITRIGHTHTHSLAKRVKCPLMTFRLAPIVRLLRSCSSPRPCVHSSPVAPRQVHSFRSPAR